MDVDIGSSKVARAISGTILSRSHIAVIDEGFVIEGRTDDELPERVLAHHRLIYTNVAELTYEISKDMLDLTANDDVSSDDEINLSGGSISANASTMNSRAESEEEAGAVANPAGAGAAEEAGEGDVSDADFEDCED